MKNGIKRVILTAFTAGRVGSSLTIGILGLSGFDIGPVSQAKCHNNAKGYFEINDLGKYNRTVIPELNGFMPFAKDIPSVIEMTKKYKAEFKLKMKEWFTGNDIAVKCPYYLPMYLFPDEYEKTIISLRRNVESQAKSVEHLNISEGDFAAWILRWQIQIDKHFTNDIEIWYEDWINNPYETYQKLANVVKPPKVLTRDEVLEFVDPKLKHY